MPNSGQGCGEAVGNHRPPVGGRWTSLRSPCGRKIHPQAVESGCAQFHTQLTWRDDLSVGPPVDTIRITRQSPPCGREIIPQSVENLPPERSNRTAGRGGGRGGGLQETTGRRSGGAPEVIWGRSGGAHETFRRRPGAGGYGPGGRSPRPWGACGAEMHGQRGEPSGRPPVDTAKGAPGAVPERPPYTPHSAR